MEKTEAVDIGKAAAYWLVTAGYMAIIFFLSSRSDVPFPVSPKYFDKVIHLTAYIPLAYLLYRSLVLSGRRRYVFAGAFIFASLYGMSDEFHQAFVPGRDASVGDFLADTTGAFVGSLGAWFTER